ncbi:BrnT family toxin [Rubrivivax gelatinosus]|uniref:hypothetical protein n=1 Tax=Rubrivivax gelatinosus TaxID=28068 RepID=UPI001052729B|nr:hypothetical protein [Rubrivivax gelatinosus]
MDRFPEIPLSLRPQLEQLNQIDVRAHRKKLELSTDRAEVLVDVINGTKDVEHFVALDIHLFCLKKIFPDQYFAVQAIEHAYSKSDLYEFDPPKNGQNIMKHGISFGEVVSFSKKFGTLMVPCPDITDAERLVVFSDLTIDSGYRLALPLNSMDFTKEIYTLSIAQQRGGGFRFISSRTFGRESCREAMQQSFKGIYQNSPEKKSLFTARCCEILEQHLFKPSPTRHSAGPCA